MTIAEQLDNCFPVQMALPPHDARPPRQHTMLINCLNWLRRRSGERAELGALLCGCALSGQVTEPDRQRARLLFAVRYHNPNRSVGPIPRAAAPDTDPANYANLVTRYALAGRAASASMRVTLDQTLTSALQANDLASGAAILRAAVLSGLDGHSDVVAAALRLLPWCASADGGFSSRWYDPTDAEPDALRLPITLDCAWTLAEHHRPDLSTCLLGSRPPAETGVTALHIVT
jgi:hypothetical protein